MRECFERSCADRLNIRDSGLERAWRRCSDKGACAVSCFVIIIFRALRAAKIQQRFQTTCVCRPSIDCNLTSGESWPLHFHLQADNTTSAVKSGKAAKNTALLVGAGFFQTASHGHLRVGHSHEDVDGFHGVLANLMAATVDLQCPQDVAEHRPQHFAGYSHQPIFADSRLSSVRKGIVAAQIIFILFSRLSPRSR